jgi:hypothetical protein
LFYNPENCNPNTALEFLVLNYYKIIVSKVQNPSQFLDILKKAIQYQLESVSQRNKNISVAEVQKLSNQKAGYAHLLFSSVMPIRFDEIDQKFIYQTGVLTQYGNDLFDYYKDIQENHQSLFTVEDSIEKVYLDFKQVLEKMLELQIECGYQESKIKAFNRMLAIPLSTFIIAFEQLSELEKTNKRDFENGKLERKLYITDMETWGNRIKLIRNYYLHPLIQRLTR